MEPHKFTVEEITFILGKINDGRPGYSENKRVAQLQAKLSMHLELAARLDRHSNFDLAEFYVGEGGENKGE